MRPAIHQNVIPQSVFPISKTQFQLIKCLHHLRNLKKNTPKTWTNTVNNWASNINFAFINDFTSAKISSCCSLFIDQLKSTGIDHYQQCLSESFDALLAQFFHMDNNMFHKSTQQVIKWYNKQFSNRACQMVVSDAEDIFHWLYNRSCQKNNDKIKIQISSNNGRRTIMNPSTNPTEK